MEIPHRVPLSVVLAVLALSAILPAQNSIQSHGTATAGTGGKLPDLWPTTTPRTGASSFGLTISNGLANSKAVGFVSLQAANTGIGGVGIFVDFNSSLQLPFVTLDAQGSQTYKLPIPNGAALIGITVYAQAFIADAGGAPLGFSATQGLSFKVANTGMVLGSRSIGGSQDPQAVVDLGTGQLNFFGATQVDNGNDVCFTKNRTHCMVPAGLGKNVSLFDCSQVPPKYVSSFTAQQIPWSVTMNPDGIRAYVVNQGAANSNPEVQVVWAIPSIPSFGTQFSGGNIKLGAVIDALAMEFTKDGRIGVLGTLGLFGGGADVRKYDTNAASTNYHKQLGNQLFSGQFMFAFAVLQDDQTVAAAVAPLGQAGQVALIDLTTMQLIDIDPKTAGYQSIGTEPGTRTPIGRVVSDMVTGPRGKYLYLANTENVNSTLIYSILQIVIDRKDPSFGKWVKVTTSSSVSSLAISDAGDRLYAATGTAIQEHDTQSLANVVRSWNVTGVGRLAFR